MTDTAESTDLDHLVSAWLTLPEVAERLSVEVSRVRQLLKEGQLAAVRRGPNNALYVPADFIQDAAVLKGLPGTLTVLADGGFDVPAALRWLFTPQDSLPGTPVEALRGNRKTEARRRAQALGF